MMKSRDALEHGALLTTTFDGKEVDRKGKKEKERQNEETAASCMIDEQQPAAQDPAEVDQRRLSS